MPESAIEAIFAAGFVDVVSAPKTDRSLLLDETRVARFLPLRAAIPLNVEHVDEAAVGWVLALKQVKRGLFCVAVITARSFLSLARRLYRESVAARTARPPLPAAPELEMLHTWLPALSLSSLHPDHMDAATPDTVFKHVALCALGRRRGTVCLYGTDLTWTLSKFYSLGVDERASLVHEAERMLHTDLSPPQFCVSSETLMAKAIDAGFISGRPDILRADRDIAALPKTLTYLKASRIPNTRQSRADALPRSSLSPVPETTPPMNSQGVMEEQISVPRSTFLALLQTNLDSLRQTPLGAPRREFMGFSVPDFTSAYHHHQTPYHPGDDCVGYLNHGRYTPHGHPSRPNKRKRDFDDGSAFPGEDTAPRYDFAALTRTLGELQEEVRALRSSTVQQQALQPLPPIPATAWTPGYAPQFIQPAPVHPFPTAYLPCTDQTPGGGSQSYQNQLQASNSSATQAAAPAPPMPPAAPSAPVTQPSPPAEPEPVNAGARTEGRSQLQKMFCNELLQQ